MDSIKQDSRFAHIAKDPRFRKMKRSERKVQIDKRFQGMFKDKRFKMKYTVDKRGRPINATTNEDLKRYYQLASDESDSSSESESENDKEKTAEKEEKQKKGDDLQKSKKEKDWKKKDKKMKESGVDKSKSEKTQKSKDQLKPQVTDLTKTKKNNDDDESGSESGDSAEEEEEGNEQEFDIVNGPDYARGLGLVSSSSSEEEDADEEEAEEEEEQNDSDEDNQESEEEPDIEHNWGELDKEAPEVEEATSRLAVCNMDWDRIKAQDLMVLLSSFKPIGGVIKSVTIYPSEYGLQRMKEEDEKGPPELTQGRKKKGKTEDEEGSEYHRERLRLYQMNRLKYYYTVVVCDSKETANKIYEECEGLEYESSSTRLDLRFIPEDMDFDQEPKSVALDVPDLATYKPSLFATSALQQSKVDLTWDETDPDRVKITMRKFDKDEVDDMNLKDYLASDSGGEDEADPYGGQFEEPDFGELDDDEEEQILKMKELVSGLKDDHDDKGVDMEITWELGLKEQTEEKQQKEEDKNLTPWDQYLQKNEKKKKQKKEEMKKKKKQKKRDEEESGGEDEDSEDDLPEGIDMNDPYFKDELDKLEASEMKTDSKKKKKRNRKEKGAGKLTPEEEAEKKQREATLELLLMDEDDQRQHFSLKAIQEKERGETVKRKKKVKLRKKKQVAEEEKGQAEDTFKFEIQDPRFTDLYDNPLYNIDPSAPAFKKTKATEALIDEKIKRRQEKMSDCKKDKVSKDNQTKQKGKKRSHENNDSAELKVAKLNELGASKDMGLASLVKSVKSKMKMHESKKKR